MYLNEMAGWIEAMEAEFKRGRTTAQDRDSLIKAGTLQEISRIIEAAEAFTEGRATVNDIAFAVDESYDAIHLLGMACNWSNINGEATATAEPWKILISIQWMFYLRREHRLRIKSYTDSFRQRRR